MPILGSIKLKNRHTRSHVVQSKDRSASKIPAAKKKAKARASRKARKVTR